MVVELTMRYLLACVLQNHGANFKNLLAVFYKLGATKSGGSGVLKISSIVTNLPYRLYINHTLIEQYSPTSKEKVTILFFTDNKFKNLNWFCSSP
jgi:hypothetical protein